MIVEGKKETGMVKTISGSYAPKKDCRLIQGEYYLKGEDCHLINDRWYRVNSGRIKYDHEKKQWTTEFASLIEGIIDFDESGNAVLGHFSANVHTNVMVEVSKSSLPELKGRSSVIAMDYQVLERNGYIERVGTNYFTKPNTLAAFLSCIDYKDPQNYQNRGHCIEENAKDYANKVRYYNEYNPEIPTKFKLYSRFLGDITWGSEIEFSSGGISDYLQNQYGIVLCRDGSVATGGEAVIIPYQGAKGLHSTVNLFKNLAKVCCVDISCSYHIHLGNIDITREFLACIYVLALRTQDEMFEAFPHYKKDPSGFKSKNYTKMLEPLFNTYKGIGVLGDYEKWLDHVYQRIFYFLSDGKLPTSECNKTHAKHPVARKWDRVSRYSWLNLVNTIFSPSRTTEFRIHQGTLNPVKAVNWLFICVAFVRYAQGNMRKLLMTNEPVSMAEVLSVYKTLYPGNKHAIFLSDYLIDYFENRKEDMRKCKDGKDFGAAADAKEDKDYNFLLNGENLI